LKLRQPTEPSICKFISLFNSRLYSIGNSFTSGGCDKAWFGWVASSSQQFYDDNVPGTPNVSVNGQEVPEQYLQSGLLDYIASQS